MRNFFALVAKERKREAPANEDPVMVKSVAMCVDRPWPAEAVLCMAIAKSGHGIGECVMRYRELNDFIESLRIKKQDKSVVYLERLYRAARDHFLTGDRSQLAKKKKQFPSGSAGPTPPLGECCAGFGGKCAPKVEHWEDPVWEALMFSIDDPERYSFEYTAKDPSKSFVIKAYADLDCDGTYATWEIHGDAKTIEKNENPTITQTEND